jgi:DNA-binding NarL/FixJ family response regulator
VEGAATGGASRRGETPPPETKKLQQLAVPVSSAHVSRVRAALSQERESHDRTRIVLGQQDFLLNAGLKVLLRSYPLFEILREDLDVPALELAVGRHSPDVAVLPVDADYDTATRLAACLSGVGLIILAHDPPFDLGASYLAQGASCVATNVTAPNLKAAIEASRHDVPIFISASGAAVTRAVHDISVLTRREQQVLTGVLARRSYAQIALELHISVETVRKHTANIRTKLGVGSLYDLICRPVSDRDWWWAGQEKPGTTVHPNARNFLPPGIDAERYPK